MTPSLPAAFLTVPLAHRALHDVEDGRPENSRAAIRAAIAAGYGIEIDLQLSKDGCAMVFHDYDLDRLAEGSGLVRDRTREDLRAIPLKGGDGEGIPDFAEVLELVGGKVPLLVEIKDQVWSRRPDDTGCGRLEAAAAQCLEGYSGDVAVMSFNPDAVAEFAKHRSDLALGLVTGAFKPKNWPELTPEERKHLRKIADFDRVAASFISHGAHNLGNPAVARLKEAGVPVLCWTIKSLAQEEAARAIADNVTFEQYLSPLTS
ncbi:glycerophosphodiester phosphodiesterase family protein [Leisingera sp. ANG-S5]|uniref:glycerophosphodiester phosphodiesterase family protein n=1 Tax=Leisingera sp. ANG-S5 TaxID=1577901 RepID=UPI00057DA9B4|nr:glycerophosphodiester phosphodiesterase family protein [Leisingera sp. ANG-S5]KIC31581.1 phosphodiesterase [Leisingera sp. ANG-S5]